MKRGQISIFIIIGIVILFMLFLGIYIERNVREQQRNFSVFTQAADVDRAITTFVEGCLALTGTAGAEYIGQQGGYFYDPPSYHPFLGYNIARYYVPRRSLVPTDVEVGAQLSAFIEDDLKFCLQNFYTLEEQGFTVSQGSIDVTSVLRQEDVLVQMHFPITVGFEGYSQVIDDFSVVLPVRLKRILEGARRMVNYQIQNPSTLDIGGMADFNVAHGFVTNSYQITDSVLLFEWIDTQRFINQKPYYFYVIHQYEVSS